MLGLLRKAWTLHKEDLAKRKDAKARAAIAAAFNARYTYRHEWVKGLPELPGTHMHFPPRGGFAWMCPDCNKIHHPYENSVFSGLQYPACCGHFRGHRLFHVKP
jgi:hypothetical protein